MCISIDRLVLLQHRDANASVMRFLVEMFNVPSPSSSKKALVSYYIISTHLLCCHYTVSILSLYCVYTLIILYLYFHYTVSILSLYCIYAAIILYLRCHYRVLSPPRRTHWLLSNFKERALYWLTLYCNVVSPLYHLV